MSRRLARSSPLIVAALLAGCAAAPPQRAPSRASCGVPSGVAHRGASAEAPENTMAAFVRAVEDGARTFELDVWWTRDGVPVVMHDATVDRTTGGHGAVAALTEGQVWRLDAGGGEHVPTLDQALGYAVRHRATVMVELKPTPSPAQLRTLLETIRRAGADRYVIVHSFNGQAVLAVRRAAPALRTALTTATAIGPAEAATYGSVLNVSERQVTTERVREWHRAGLKVYAWTADTPSDWKSLTAAGVDGILTNRIGAYQRWAEDSCG